MSWRDIDYKASRIGEKMARKITAAITKELSRKKAANWRIYASADGVGVFVDLLGDQMIDFKWREFYDGIMAATTAEEIYDTLAVMSDICARMEKELVKENGVTLKQHREFRRKEGAK